MSKQRTFSKEIVRSQGEDYLLKYDRTEKMYALVSELAGFGLNDNEMSRLFSIDYRRFAELKAGDDDLRNAIEIGRARATANVTRALYSKCVGYHYDEVNETVVTNEDTGKTTHTISTKTKHIAPSDNAIIFWLSNRTDNWKQSSKIQIGRGTDEQHDLSAMDADKLQAYVEQMKAKLNGAVTVSQDVVDDDEQG